MPEKDFDPPAGSFGGDARFKTPWESINPDEPAQSAPVPKRKPSKNPRRRAKAAAAEQANSDVPSVSITTSNMKTDGVTDDPDDAFATLAFLPDEHFALAEMAGAAAETDEQTDEPAKEDSDEPLVEIFLDTSANESDTVTESEKRLTTSTGVVSGGLGGITENVDDVLAEKAFLSDERIPPPKPDEPAANVNSQTGESTRENSGKPPAEFFADVSPEYSIAEIVRIVEPPPRQPQITSSVEIHGTSADLPDSTPPAVLHADVFAVADSGIEPTTTAVSMIESVVERSDNEPRIAFPTDLFGATESGVETTITAAVQPLEPAAPIVASTSSSQTGGPVIITDGADVEPVRTTAPPIRYLKPVAGTPIHRPAPPALSPGIADDTELDPDPELALVPVTTGGGWTIPLMCLGIGLIACCVIIPQADLNRRLYYERQALQADLESIQKQVAVNDEFLKEVIDNPTLAERLASRQMKTIRKGQKVLAVRQINDDGDMSPFALVAVPRPPTPEPYQPVIGTIANLCNNPRSRLYLLGMSMTMVAVGLVLGFSPQKMQE